MRALVILGVMALLSGCVPIHYENGVQTFRQDGVVPGDASRFAVLKTEPCDGADCLIIFRVDDKPRGVGYIKRYDLRPGIRKITFKYLTPRYTSTHAIVMAFNAEAGHAYRTDLVVDISAMRWYPRIIDIATQRIVSERSQ